MSKSIDERIELTRARLLETRMKRMEENESHDKCVTGHRQRQIQIKQDLVKFGSINKYREEFSLDDNFYGDSIISREQAQLCQYLHKMFADQQILRIMRQQNMDLNRLCEQEINKMDEELTVRQIQLLNDIAVKAEEVEAFKTCIRDIQTHTAFLISIETMMNNKRRKNQSHNNILSQTDAFVEAEAVFRTFESIQPNAFEIKKLANLKNHTSTKVVLKPSLLSRLREVTFKPRPTE
eukprot:CAMPEP_0202453414 /NCGR_PEP_ID=MMETSP1360-20130828/11395_1 /ASSEMBLY_ACC=CAM_ASM_000848 /TAXON_ID=515479 /ORGANISM="Licmophora paradoxa, Strain CCMP2313" /LENGTH=236 /DNA_ID=CAMNT_0049072497 /DNA_START=67 /DNA_END=777 /DNA_ORIENTATION=+